MRPTIIAIVLAVGLGLAGCSSAPTTIVSDAADCTATLVAAGIVSPSSIIGVAAITPSCQRLALDALNEIVKLASAKSASARAAMGRR